MNIDAIKEEAQEHLLTQLKDALNFIKNYNYSSEKEVKSTSELFLVDIFKYLKEPCFKTEDQEIIKEKAYTIINEAILTLKNSLSKESTKKIEMETYKKLTELLFVTSDYVKKTKEYNETYLGSNINKK